MPGVVFGLTGTGGYGVLNSVRNSQSAEIAECRGTTGKVTNQQAYSITAESTSEGVFNGDTLANAGTSLTIGATTGLITSWEKTETNNGYQMISCTVQKKDSATQVAYS